MEYERIEAEPIYLVVKPPAFLTHAFPCGNPDNCTCTHMSTPYPPDFDMCIIPYYKGFMDSDEQYATMKELGLIMHETEDPETADMLMNEMVEALEAERCRQQ